MSSSLETGEKPGTIMNSRIKARLYATSAIVGMSTLITVMGAPWKFNIVMPWI